MNHTVKLQLLNAVCITIVLFLLLAAPANAQSVKYHFPQGVFEFSGDYADNRITLELMDAFIRSANDHTAQQIGRIRITGFSSIEGTYTTNERLARDRAVHFHHFLVDRHPNLNKIPADLAWVGEDWVTLARMVRESHINEREEILRIISNVRLFDERERLLRQLNGGLAYRAMEELLFSALRRVEVVFECGPGIEGTTSPAEPTADNPTVVGNDTTGVEPYGETDNTGIADTPGHTSLTESVRDARRKFEETEYLPKPQKTAKHHRIAVKTNLLQWAGLDADLKTGAPIINGAVEFFFTPRWSVEAGGLYTYKQKNKNEQFRGISGYRLEARRYLPLAKNRLDGFLGLYGRVGDYDYRREQNTINHTGEYWDAGLSAGLALRLAGSWWIEAGARAGYLATDAIRYEKEDPYNWYETTVPYSKVRLTEVGVSVVWRFWELR